MCAGVNTFPDSATNASGPSALLFPVAGFHTSSDAESGLCAAWTPAQAWSLLRSLFQPMFHLAVRACQGRPDYQRGNLSAKMRVSRSARVRSLPANGISAQLPNSKALRLPRYPAYPERHQYQCWISALITPPVRDKPIASFWLSRSWVS